MSCGFQWRVRDITTGGIYIYIYIYRCGEKFSIHFIYMICFDVEYIYGFV